MALLALNKGSFIRDASSPLEELVDGREESLAKWAVGSVGELGCAEDFLG